jgi:hypothetical protein
MRLFSNLKFLFMAAVFLVFLPKISFASTFSQGDINSDNCVNANDSTAWLASFHGTSGPADINTDHTVDVKDLAFVAKDYGPCKPKPIPNFQSQSPFGIEYGREFRNIPFTPTPLSSFWKDTGAQWVKLNDVEWGNIEANAPVNGVHTYNWSALDHDVSKENGLGVNDRPNWDAYFNIVIELRAYSPWGQKPSNATNPLVTHQGRPPKDQNLQDYHDWVRAVVERYDHDGFQDGPDLTRAVSVYEIESEGSGDANNLFYSATPAEYATQLKAAYTAVKEADPNALVMLNGLNLRDLFADGSTESQVVAKLNSLNYQDSVFDAQSLLDGKAWMDSLLAQTKGYFDIVENHELGTWRQMSGGYAWIASELQAHGIDLATTQIWAGDAVSAGNLSYLSGLETNPPFGQPLSVAGVPDNPLSKNLALLSIMGNNNNIYNDLNCVMGSYAATLASCKPTDSAYQAHIVNDHAAYDKWYRRLQAEELVKKYVYGIAAGYRVTEMGTLTNWPSYVGFQEDGFLDVNPTNSFLNGNPRPIWYTYQLMVQKIGTLSAVSRIDVGRSDFFVYQVTLASGAKVYVMWSDSGVDVVPTQATPDPVYQSSSFSFSLSGGTAARITPAIVDRNQTSAQPFVVSPNGSGNVPLILTSTPIFLEIL